MAITYVGSSTTGFVATGNPPAAIGGIANGNVVIGYAFCSVSAFTAAPGWTTIDNRTDGNTGWSQYIAWRKMDGTGNDAFAPGYSSNSQILAIVGFAGQDATNPIDTSAITQWGNTASTVFPPNVTPSVNDDMLFTMYGENGNGATEVTAPPGFSVAVGTNTTGGVTSSSYYKALTGQNGVAQGPINYVWSTTAYGPAVAILIKAQAASAPASYPIRSDMYF